MSFEWPAERCNLEQLAEQGKFTEAALCLLWGTVDLLLALSLGVAVIYFIICGIRFLTAGGDEKALVNAKNSLTHAVIGFIVILFAITIVKILEGWFEPSVPLVP